MPVIDIVALSIVVISGLYMLALGSASLVVPKRASRFLLGFASSQSLHFIEVLLRFTVGSAFILYAPRMWFSTVYTIFGWVLIITTTGLLLVPWRWHQRFARQTVPPVTRFMMLLGLTSLALGGFIFVVIIHGS